MTRARRNPLPYRGRMRRFTKSGAFPRWITIPFLLAIGSILWLGVLSDSSGHLSTPGAGSILYLVAVIGVAAFLALTDRN